MLVIAGGIVLAVIGLFVITVIIGVAVELFPRKPF